MLSSWGPRCNSGQRRNPGIYSAKNPRPKRTALDSVEESGSRPLTENSLSSFVSSLVGGYPETSRSAHTDHIFRPATDPSKLFDASAHRKYSYKNHERLGFRETAFSSPTTGKHYHDDTFAERNSYSVESSRWQSESSIYGTQYGMQHPHTGSLRDRQVMLQHSQIEPRFEYLDITTRTPLYPSVAIGTDDKPVYTTPSQDCKTVQYSDNESQAESPSTMAPDSQTDSRGNSSDSDTFVSDAPPVRRGFTSEDSPDGSSDSDVPASTTSESAGPATPDIASIEPQSEPHSLSSDDNLTSSDEAPIGLRCLKSLNSQPRHPLAVIGWTGELPSEESPNASPTACADLLIPTSPLPPRPVRSAKECSQSAKRLTQALETELRDLEDEMSSLTQDLIAMKRTIPARSPDGDLVFQERC